MATLDLEDIENIAAAVVRKLNMQPGVDLHKVAEMPLKERQAFWKAQRAKEKRA